MQWTPAEKGYFCTVDATPIDDGCGKPAVWKLYEDQMKAESYWCDDHKKDAEMKVTANHPDHGLYQASARALDEAIARYLPNSVDGLRKVVQERVGEDLDYSDVDSVGFFLVMLAEFDGEEEDNH